MRLAVDEANGGTEYPVSLRLTSLQKDKVRDAVDAAAFDWFEQPLRDPGDDVQDYAGLPKIRRAIREAYLLDRLRLEDLNEPLINYARAQRFLATVKDDRVRKVFRTQRMKDLIGWAKDQHDPSPPKSRWQ